MTKHREEEDMPIIPTPDGEVERRNAYVRLNPTGQKEFVRVKNGKDEETLNELSDYLDSLIEDIQFTNMPALSAEQPPSQRITNQMAPPQLVASGGDSIRNNGDTITNMTVAPQTSALGLGPTPADSPEISRAKANLRSNPIGDRLASKDITDYDGDKLDYGATHSESREWLMQMIADSIE